MSKSPKKMKRAGRPTTWDSKIAYEILRRISLGETTRSACREIGFNISTFRQWLVDDRQGIYVHYMRAREQQAESFMDDCVEIADDTSKDTYQDAAGDTKVDHEHINRSRLRVDTRKWLMSKLHPKIYSERIQAEVSGPNGDPIAVFISEIRGTAQPKK